VAIRVDPGGCREQRVFEDEVVRGRCEFEVFLAVGNLEISGTLTTISNGEAGLGSWDKALTGLPSSYRSMNGVEGKNIFFRSECSNFTYIRVGVFTLTVTKTLTENLACDPAG